MCAHEAPPRWPSLMRIRALHGHVDFLGTGAMSLKEEARVMTEISS